MRIYNRTFNRSYTEIETFEAGITLTGAEVKAVRQGNIRLEKAFGKIIDGELFLLNAEISIYKYARPQEYEPTRKRKLLVHKKEIVKLSTKLQGAHKLTLVPLSCYNKGSYIKICMALARGKGDIVKKKLERREDVKRQQQREMKEYIKK